MRDLINLMEAVERGCPPATQSIDLNLKNRQKAIDEYGYGPLDPNEPNEEFWQRLADKWNTDDIESVMSSRCGNCAAFDVTEKMQNCIARGIGAEAGSDPHDTVDAGELGYCKFLKFKCASKRTCDAWVEGGPIQEAHSPEHSTAMAVAKELHGLIQELGQTFQGKVNPDYRQRLKRQIQELDQDLVDLGYLYNPRKRDFLEFLPANHE